MLSNTHALEPTKGAKPTKGIHSNMKSAHLIAVALGGIALIAGAASLNTAYVHIDRAQGNGGTGSYSMTLKNTTNTLFQGVSGAGTASSTSRDGNTIGFKSYVLSGTAGVSRGDDVYTLTGCHNNTWMMLTNTSPFYDITEISVTFTEEEGVSARLGNFKMWSSPNPITSRTFDSETMVEASVSTSGVAVDTCFGGTTNHYFALIYGGDSSKPSNTYRIAVSEMVIYYNC